MNDVEQVDVHYYCYTKKDIFCLSTICILFAMLSALNFYLGMEIQWAITAIAILLAGIFSYPVWKRVWNGGVQHQNGRWEWFSDNE